MLAVSDQVPRQLVTALNSIKGLQLSVTELNADGHVMSDCTLLSGIVVRCALVALHCTTGVLTATSGGTLYPDRFPTWLKVRG